MGDFQLLYGFCIVFIASTLMIVAYYEGFEDVEFYFEPEESGEDKNP